MQKTGILTFHAAYNFGSNLQAYALQKTIKKLGDENCEIINYKSKSQKAMYSIINTQTINKGTIAKSLLNVLNYKKILKRNQHFEDFIKNYLSKSSEKYINENEVKRILKNYKNIVCGSDQIWNLSPKTYDRSKLYYLDFDYSKDINTISYAPSFGNDIDFLKENFNEISRMVKKFKHISIREKDAVEYFRKNNIEAELTLDPTLLLSEKEWDELIGERIIEEPYILYYSLNCKKYSIDFTKNIQKATGLNVINPYLHPKAINSGFKNFIEIGPIEFLNLLKNAEYVCTNSFHGTVFSILLEKPFFAIFDEKDGKIIRENRKASLLEQIGLEGRMYTVKSNIDLRKNVNFGEAKSKLEKIKQKSLNFLKESLV